MALISQDVAFEKFRRLGRNSSHFVWFLAKLEFYETANGWVFGFLRSGKVILFALEPLFPDPAAAAAEFHAAWKETEEALKPGVSFFVSVYEEFLVHLKTEKFTAIQVGKEPYVLLADCIPTGKSGKGVRAARNQALRAGMKVEEYTEAKILENPKIIGEMRKILRAWSQRKVVDLGGFLNTVNPFERMSFRRYFIASDKDGELQGFLVATPIPGCNSFFLEDLILRPDAARGAGELLTLETMASLGESKASFASLGVVSLTSAARESAEHLPWAADLVLITLPKYLSRLYNVAGLETFRKRFKPQRWEKIFLALKNHPRSGISDNQAWFSAFGALIRSFAPRLNLSWELPRRWIERELHKHPISTALSAIATLSFVCINKGGALPPWALQGYGFSGDSHIAQWAYRTITSDFLFFDSTHFFSSLLFLFFLIRWMERSYPIKFLLGVFIGGMFFDDIIDQAVLVAPYSYFHPRLFHNLVAIKDVGPSLWIALALGVQLCTLRKYREILFAGISIGIVLVFAFSAAHLSTLVLNLNHSLFFALGFITGKIRFEYERVVSKRVARQKPPVGKSVATAPRRRSTDKVAPAPEAEPEPDAAPDADAV